MYSIKLNDGTKLENLVKNGDCFISQEKIEDSVFEGNLAHVEIKDEETGEVTVLENGYLAKNDLYEGEYWIALIRKPFETQIAEVLAGATGDITDIEIALAEIYEMII